eukprot:117824-Pyramimonas_sp.AAC.1
MRGWWPPIRDRCAEELGRSILRAPSAPMLSVRVRTRDPQAFDDLAQCLRSPTMARVSLMS